MKKETHLPGNVYRPSEDFDGYHLNNTMFDWLTENKKYQFNEDFDQPQVLSSVKYFPL